jgi:hypothetical protein
MVWRMATLVRPAVCAYECKRLDFVNNAGNLLEHGDEPPHPELPR